MYTGRVACCPVVSHGQYADGTDRQTDERTPDHYTTLSTMDVAGVITTQCGYYLFITNMVYK